MLRGGYSCIMSVEVVAALGIAGTIIGAVAGTVIGAYANYHYSQKAEERNVKVEEWKNVLDEVYSPLMFDLNLIPEEALSMLMTYGRIHKESPSKSVEVSAVLITRIAQAQTRYTQNQMQLGEMLRKKTRLIKPVNLWVDLSSFYAQLQMIERLFVFVSTDFFKDSPERLVAAMKDAAEIAEILNSAALHIRNEIQKLVISKHEVPQPRDYTLFFTDAVTTKMDEQNESISKKLLG